MMIWLLGVIVIILGLIIITFTYNRSIPERYDGLYDLPPLNYFESPDRNILSYWYDPIVSSSEGEQTTWGLDRDNPNSNTTNIDDVFGPYSRYRYYLEDVN